MTRILVLAGSNRADSPNRRLAAEAARLLSGSEAVEVRRLDLADYAMPVFDGDGAGEAADDLPEAALRLAGQIAASDGLLLASPECNRSVAPLVASAIGWTARVRRLDGRPVLPFRGLVVGLASAAPGRHGGLRGLSALRELLVSLGAEVVARECAVARADAAFDEAGRLRDAADRGALEAFLESLVDIAIALRRG